MKVYLELNIRNRTTVQEELDYFYEQFLKCIESDVMDAVEDKLNFKYSDYADIRVIDVEVK